MKSFLKLVLFFAVMATSIQSSAYALAICDRAGASAEAWCEYATPDRDCFREGIVEKKRVFVVWWKISHESNSLILTIL